MRLSHSRYLLAVTLLLFARESIFNARGAASLSLDTNFRSPLFVELSPATRFVLLPDGKFLRFGGQDTLSDQRTGAITRYLSDGTLDTSFSFSHDYKNIAAAAATADGHVIITATQYAYGTTSKAVQILRLNSDGSLDPTFNVATVGSDSVSVVRSIVLQPDGKILVAGDFDNFAGVQRGKIVRLLADGTLDPSFISPSFAGPYFASIWAPPVVLADGRILVAGSFTVVNGSSSLGVARLNSNGSVDATFIPQGFNRGSGSGTPIRGLVVQSDGKVVIAGRLQFGTSGPIKFPLLRLNADGIRDTSFATYNAFGTATTSRALLTQADGKFVAVINSSVYRFNTDGTLDNSFAQPVLLDNTLFPSAVTGTPISAALQADERIIFSGIFTDVNANASLDGSHFGIARLNSNGTVDSSLVTTHRSGFESFPSSFARQPDGSTLISFGIDSYRIEPATPFNLGRLLPDGSRDTSFSLSSTDPNSVLTRDFLTHDFISLADGNLFVFGLAADYMSFNVASFLPSGVESPAFESQQSIAFTKATAASDGKLFVSAEGDAQATVYSQLRRLRADGGFDDAFGIPQAISGAQIMRGSDGSLISLSVGSYVLASQLDGKVLFLYLSGNDRQFHFVRLNTDGSVDQSFAAASFSPSDLVLDYPFIFDPVTGVGLQPPGGAYYASPPLTAAQILEDGRIVLAGAFTSYSGVPARGLVRLQGNGQVDNTFNVGGGAQWTGTQETSSFFPKVETIALQTDGKLLIAGTFEAFNGTPLPGIASLNANGSVDPSFTPPAKRLKPILGTAQLSRQPDSSFLLSGPYSFPNENDPSFIHINSIGGIPVVGSPTIATAIVNQPFSYQIVASGQPTSYNVSGSPAHFSFNSSTGLISGAPTAGDVGTYNLALTATNAEGTSAARQLTLRVTGGEPEIASPLSATAQVGAPFSYQIAATNRPTNYAADNLPSGLTINGVSGLISGTPNSAGTSNVSLRVSNGAGVGVATLTIIVQPPPPVITGALSVTAQVGVPFSYQIAATNQPTSYGADYLPSGLTIDQVSGLINGTPNFQGTSYVNLHASNGAGFASATLIITVQPPPPVILSATTATATVGQFFTYPIQATNNPTSFSAIGLPPGLRLDFGNLINGTPTTAGLFNVTISATNSGGTSSVTLALTVRVGAPVITSAGSAGAVEGEPFSYQIVATNNPTSYGVTNLPAGLSLNSTTGLISGSTSAVGSSIVTVSASNSTGTSSLQIFFTVQPQPPVITSATSATVTQGQPFSYQITATRSPTSFAATGLPAGLTLNSATGLISGTPTVTGTFPITVTAIRAIFFQTLTGSATLTLTVTPPPSGVANISTRLAIGTDTNVLIGGFIITGDAPKRLIIRAIGPSLKNGATPIPGRLADPTLELRAGSTSIGFNDDWRSNQEQEIIASAVAPTDDRESALIATLAPGAYTAIVSGKDRSIGIGLVEVFELPPTTPVVAGTSKIANLSTRGFVQTRDDVMIGGFIITGGTTHVIVRAIGPELTQRNVAGALQDTTLELVNSSGVTIASNDDWRSSQEQEIIATTVPPTDDRESAIVANLGPGAYTAIVRGKNESTGVALAEIFVLP